MLIPILLINLHYVNIYIYIYIIANAYSNTTDKPTLCHFTYDLVKF